MSKKVLLIDDDTDLIEVMRLTLESKGFEVIDAQNGTRGLEMAKSERPDIIILDVMMDTVHEGFDVAKKMRSIPETEKIPIIMLTAIAQQTGYKYGKDKCMVPVDEFLEKPIMPGKLVNIINKQLNIT